MRGGKREKAGRKSTWKSGCKFEETKLIRVPNSIADKVLAIAHKIDAGEVLDLDTKPKEVNLAQSSQLELIGNSGWKSGSTTKIDVPIVLSERIIVVARQLDEDLAKKNRGDLGLICPRCQSSNIGLGGRSTAGKQRYQCKTCSLRFTPS